MISDEISYIKEKIKEIIDNRLLLKISMEGIDFERLTIAREFKTDKKGISSFMIDLPEEFSGFLPDGRHRLILHFEFSGKDSIPYHFKSNEFEVSKTFAWIRFPDLIERLQNRKDFRISVPKGSMISFKKEGLHLEFSINNISLGGLLCYTISIKTENESLFLLKAGEKIRNLKLVIGSQMKKEVIFIEAAKVVRIQQTGHIKKMGYGIEFSQIDNKEKRILTQVIYHIQREFLKRRLSERK